MNHPARHIIGKLRLSLSYDRQETRADTQKEIEVQFRHHFIPELEKLLDGFDTGNKVVSIDKISIDLGTVNPENFAAVITGGTLSELRSVLSGLISEKRQIPGSSLQDSAVAAIDLPVQVKAGRIEAYSDEEKTLEAFLYFLSSGTLPLKSGWVLAVESGIGNLLDAGIIARSPSVSNATRFE